MAENKDQQRKVNTCLEGSPCAEMMRKLGGGQGVGSLCEEMMRTLMKRFRESGGEPQEAGKEEGHGSEK